MVKCDQIIIKQHKNVFIGFYRKVNAFKHIKWFRINNKNLIFLKLKLPYLQQLNRQKN